MSNSPLVSIVILTHNHDSSISKNLDMILDQDYDNIEIIVGDDASSDATPLILKQYKQSHPDKITIILNESKLGITGNCNSALSVCSGKYITFNGGDDQMLPGKISTQVDYLESHPDCDLCYHNMEAFDAKTDEVLYYTHLDGNGRRKRDIGNVRDAIKEGVFFSPVSAMIRMADIPKNLFDTRLPNTSDWLFFVEVLAQGGGQAEYIDAILGRYARSINSITINRPKDFVIEIDLLNSCNILLVKFPQYYKQILYRYSRLIFRMRNKDKENYAKYLKTSLGIKITLKALIAYLLYIGTLGRVRK